MEDEVWVGFVEQVCGFGVWFDFDVFGLWSFVLVEKVGVVIKLYVMDIINYGFFDQVVQSGVDWVVFGVGGVWCDEVDVVFVWFFGKMVVLMLGFQVYLIVMEDNQIVCVVLLLCVYEGVFNVVVGFGDYVLLEIGLVMVLLVFVYGVGVRVLEKYLIFGCNMKLEDYEFVLNFDEFEIYVYYFCEMVVVYGVIGLDVDFGMSEVEG